jgi:hypothetical protein
MPDPSGPAHVINREQALQPNPRRQHTEQDPGVASSSKWLLSNFLLYSPAAPLPDISTPGRVPQNAHTCRPPFVTTFTLSLYLNERPTQLSAHLACEGANSRAECRAAQWPRTLEPPRIPMAASGLHRGSPQLRRRLRDPDGPLVPTTTRSPAHRDSNCTVRSRPETRH